MIENLTVAARDALELARRAADTRGHARVEALHLLHALVFEPRCGVERVFRTLGVRRPDVRREIEELLAPMPFAARDAVRADSPALLRALDLAAEEARQANYDRVDTHHLLMGLVLLGDPVLAGVLSRAGLTVEKIRPLMGTPLDVRKIVEKTLSKVTLGDLEKKGFRRVKVLREGEIAVLACPHGHGPMDQVEREGVKLAVCGECMSTFFAPGQLEELLRKLPAPTPEALRRFLEPEPPE